MYQAAVVKHVVSAVTWLGPMIIERLEQAPDAGLPPPRSPARRVVLLTARVNLLAVLTMVVLAVLLIRP